MNSKHDKIKILSDETPRRENRLTEKYPYRISLLPSFEMAVNYVMVEF